MIIDWLIRRAQRTPYFHLPGYMDRWWLFNGYEEGHENERRYPRLPSIRIHHIKRADQGRHLHDHPWNARTFILRGWYKERRLEDGRIAFHLRKAGDTAKLRYGEYHTIDEVNPAGVWTLFVIGKYRGPWGFLVDGKKIIHTDYWRQP